MKQSRNIALGLLYLVMTVGISMNSHYCGGYLLDTYVYAAPSCAFCDDVNHTPTRDDCCDDETEFFTLDTDHMVVAENFECKPIEISKFVSPFPILDLSVDQAEIAIGYYILDDPPPSRDLYIIHHQFTFYG